MARIARVVAEGIPHHVTQRGNARQVIFDDPKDRHVYLKLLRGYAEEHRLRISAWCLMDNHIHLLATPETPRALARTLGCTHSDYARYRNVQLASCGHIFQSRYYSCPVERAAIWRVMAYIELNPVRAGLVESAEYYRWSSARAHITGRDQTAFVDMHYWRECYTGRRWREALRSGLDDEAIQERLRQATRTGRPFGSVEFLEHVESATRRELRARRAGRPKKAQPAREYDAGRQMEIGVLSALSPDLPG